MKRKQLYFDGAADAPVMKESFKAMKPFLTHGWVGNAHSVHANGIEASVALNNAKNDILASLGFDPDSSLCILTSGASEGNNMVVRSCLENKMIGAKDKERFIAITGETEHESLLDPIKYYTQRHHKNERWSNMIALRPNPNTGSIDRDSARRIAQLLNFFRETQDSFVVALLALSPVNNETGAYNDVNGVLDELRCLGIPIMYSLLDCTQSLSCGGIEMDLARDFPNYDYFVFGGHKIGGPEGIGAVIARKGKNSASPKTGDLSPLIIGGSQEFGLRAGTSNVFGAVGMAAALRTLRRKNLYCKFCAMHDELITGLAEIDPGLKINGGGSPNIVSVTFSEPFAKQILQSLEIPKGDDLTQFFNMSLGISVSAAAACSAGDDIKPSHVLTALGLTSAEIGCTVRFSFAWNSNLKDVVECLKRIKKHAEITGK